MRVPPLPRAMVPVLAAVAGVVVSHAVDYALVFPHGGVRSAHLEATGHGYWPAAVAVATVAAALALLIAAALGARHAFATLPSRGWREVGRLVAWQGVAFAALEAGERGLAGLPPSVLLSSPEFWFGLLLQLPVAWLAVRFLHVVELTAAKVAATLRRRGRAVPVLPAPAASARLPRTALVAPVRSRAPPLVA